MKESQTLINYLAHHPEITDVLFTGGDPIVMKAKTLKAYIDPLISQNNNSLQNIRIGTKALSYWPYRFLTDPDADDLLRLFENIVSKNYHLAIMAHFNHPRELKTKAVKKAIKRILNTGAQIRTQSPIMNHINNNYLLWKEMWKEQVKLGCIPYYMFVARNTSAQNYFAVSLENAWKVFRKAYQRISGISRTVRGPVMSADPGKVQILGTAQLNGKKCFIMRLIQGRDPAWVGQPFFAEHNSTAIWVDELKPLNSQTFFFEQDHITEEIILN